MVKAKAKHASKPTRLNYLTIEFAGICALVTRSKASNAEVWLPDVMQAAPPAQASPHFASLIVRSEEPQGVAADSTVTFPAHPPEYAVWNLRDTTVSFDSDVKTGVTTPARPKGKHAQPIERLADIWQISTPKSLNAAPPNTATVVIDHGELASLMPPFKGQEYVFYKGTTPTTQEKRAAKEYAWRFRVKVPFNRRLDVVLKTQGQAERRLHLMESTAAVIANLCQEVGSAKNHFYAYYGLVDGGTAVNIQKRAKTIKGAAGESYPNWEYCFSGRISEP